MKPFTIEQQNWVNAEIGRHVRQQQTNHERAEEIIKAREAEITRLHERAHTLETALRDAVSTYMGADKLVTSERIEAWQEALK